MMHLHPSLPRTATHRRRDLVRSGLRRGVLAVAVVFALPGCAKRATFTTGAVDDAPNAGDTGDIDEPDETPTGTTGDGDGDGDGDDPCDTFLGCLDVAETCGWCDFWAQDCGQGEKCTPIPSTPGSGAWDAHICVPVGTAPPGSACTMVDGIDGADTCDATGMCLGLDPSGVGTCTEFCVGSPDNHSCPKTGNECFLLNDGILNICPSTCDPLLAGQCPPGQTCTAGFEGGNLNGFICFAPAAEGISGEACECANCCADGHTCTSAASYGPDCADDLCCTEYCDVTDLAFTCVGQGQQCIALFDPNDPNYANVGACMVP